MGSIPLIEMLLVYLWSCMKRMQYLMRFGNGFVAFIEMLLVSAALSGEYVLFAYVLLRDSRCDLHPSPTPTRLLSSFSLPYLYKDNQKNIK